MPTVMHCQAKFLLDISLMAVKTLTCSDFFNIILPSIVGILNRAMVAKMVRLLPPVLSAQLLFTKTTTATATRCLSPARTL